MNIFKAAVQLSVVMILASASLEAAYADLAFDFSPTPLGTTKSLSLNLTVNGGYSIVSLTGTGISSPYSINPNSCLVESGGSCTLTESFNPETIGEVSAGLQIIECKSFGMSCFETDIAVDGSGYSVFNPPSTVSFSNVEIGQTKSLPINLSLDAGFSLDSLTGTGIDSPFSINPGNCLSNSGVSCTMTESYSPQDVVSSAADLQLVECQNVGPTCIEKDIALSGSGYSNFNPATTVTLPDTALGKTSSATINVTLDAGFTLDSLTGTGIGSPFSVNPLNCFGSTAGPCTLTESFSPTTAGAVSSSLELVECQIGPVCRERDITIDATGVSTFQDGAHDVDFGDVAVNSSESLPIYLATDAGYKLVSLSDPGAPFSTNLETCVFESPCTIQETFLPNADGSFAASIDAEECITKTDSCLTTTYALSGTAGTTSTGTTEVPEPTTLSIFAFASVGLLFKRKKRKATTCDFKLA